MEDLPVTSLGELECSHLALVLDPFLEECDSSQLFLGSSSEDCDSSQLVLDPAKGLSSYQSSPVDLAFLVLVFTSPGTCVCV